MLRGDEKYGDEFTKRQSEFADVLKVSGLPDAVRNEISSLMKAYRENFARYMVTQSSLNDEVDDFATVFQRNARRSMRWSRLGRALSLVGGPLHAAAPILIWTIAGATFCIGLLAVFSDTALPARSPE